MTRVLVVAALLAVPGVASAQDPAPVPPPAPAGDVVARIDGTTIERADLLEAAGPALARLRQQEFEILRGELERLLDRRLLARAAGPNGSADGWLAAEVARRATGPALADVDAYYERHAAAFSGQTKEQARPAIRELLLGEARRRAERDILRELRARARIEVLLEPVRAELAAGPYPPLGADDAPVTITWFGDYEDPFTREAATLLADIRRTYGRTVRLVFRDFPAPFHGGAVEAAKAARCADAQGRFWAMHERLLAADVRAFRPAPLGEMARAAGLDAAAFEACLAAPGHAPAILAEVEAGRRAGLDTPPGFFVNGRPLPGILVRDDLAALIEAELARAGIPLPTKRSERSSRSDQP